MCDILAVASIFNLITRRSIHRFHFLDFNGLRELIDQFPILIRELVDKELLAKIDVCWSDLNEYYYNW